MPTRSGGAAWPSRRCTPGARRCGSKSKHGRRTIRSPKLWRAQGCCEPTRIECCCALSKAARSAASHGLLRTDQDRVLLRFVEGRPVSRVTRAVANRPGSSAAALCRRPPGQPRHHGLLRTDQDRVLLRFVEGRPVSRVTTDFLAWGADRLAAEDKRVWVLVWDNAAWHV